MRVIHLRLIALVAFIDDVHRNVKRIVHRLFSFSRLPCRRCFIHQTLPSGPGNGGVRPHGVGHLAVPPPEREFFAVPVQVLPEHLV